MSLAQWEPMYRCLHRFASTAGQNTVAEHQYWSIERNMVLAGGHNRIHLQAGPHAPQV